MKGNERKAECKKTYCRFEELTLRTCPQNGITLIALIITIIVMLILVGVTINVALKGNLFEQAQYAAEETQIQAEKEQLLSAVVGAIGTDAKVDFNKLEENLPYGWTGSNGTYTSPKGNIFTVDKNGNIDYKGKNTIGGGSSPVAFDWETVGLKVDTNTEYIAGDFVLYFSTDGKLSIVSEGMNLVTVDAKDPKYISNGILDFTEELDYIEEKVMLRLKIEMNSNNTDINLTTIYFDEEGIEQEPDVTTCVKTSLDDEDIYTNEEVLQALGATGGEYKGTWTVIERDESGNPTKLVSTTAVTYCILGDYDDLEKCISDYQNAESILNTKAKEATGISSARSINIEDIYAIVEENVNKGADYGVKYNYYYENGSVYSRRQTGTEESGEIIWSEPQRASLSSQTFVNDSGTKVVVDSEGDNVTLTDTSLNDFQFTEEQISKLGTLTTGSYWIASPYVVCNFSYATFIITYFDKQAIEPHTLFVSSYDDFRRRSLRGSCFHSTLNYAPGRVLFEFQFFGEFFTCYM